MSRRDEFHLSIQRKRDRATVAATNKTGTSILAFEYTQLREPFDFAHHQDETASISGTIDAIVPNPNKSRFSGNASFYFKW